MFFPLYDRRKGEESLGWGITHKWGIENINQNKIKKLKK